MTAPLPVRPARLEDAAELYRVCLRTGDAGGDATDRYRDGRLLGDVYVGPYLALAPELAFVLAGPDDEPLGYVLGVADTAAFEAACERHWWPALRRRHPLGSVPAGSPDAALVGLLHRPARAPADVLVHHPAHLHVDLLPAAQGQGHGRRLLEHLFEALRARGVPGVHVGVDPRNHRALAVYRHLGFRPVGQSLGLRLD